jgi:hypothetical protein
MIRLEKLERIPSFSFEWIRMVNKQFSHWIQQEMFVSNIRILRNEIIQSKLRIIRDFYFENKFYF